MIRILQVHEAAIEGLEEGFKLITILLERSRVFSVVTQFVRRRDFETEFISHLKEVERLVKMSVEYI